MQGIIRCDMQSNRNEPHHMSDEIPKLGIPQTSFVYIHIYLLMSFFKIYVFHNTNKVFTVINLLSLFLF